MIDLVALSKRAESSGDHEAYVAVARNTGYRIGVGARKAADLGPRFFVEVVLDPFPSRPKVDLDELVMESAMVRRLHLRGYTLACDDAGVITCERTFDRRAVLREVREVQGILDASREKTRARRRPRTMNEAS